MSREDDAVIEQPQWLDLPEDIQSVYWVCHGRFQNPRIVQPWTIVCRSAGEAEMDARMPKASGWQWDGSAPIPVRLEDALRVAEALGRRGVRVKAFVGGKWQIIGEHSV